MAGILKIHSNGAGPLSAGHSWIEYSPFDGQSTTFGTWGNSPTGSGDGLLQNAEGDRKSDATRICIIDDEQQRRLFKLINAYRDRGTQAWTLLTPCSTFASEAWEQATGEHLVHQTAGVSTPSRLARSIIEANRNDHWVDLGSTVPKGRSSSSTTHSAGRKTAKRPGQAKKRTRRM